MNKRQATVAWVLVVVATALAVRVLTERFTVHDGHALPLVLVVGTVGLYATRDCTREPDRGWLILAVGAVLYLAAYLTIHVTDIG